MKRDTHPLIDHRPKNFALAFPIPRELALAWLTLRATDTAVAMSPLVGSGDVLFVQWVTGRGGYRWLLRIAASLRQTHGLSAVVFKPMAPPVLKVALRLGAWRVSTDGDGEERWILAGDGAVRWLGLGKPIPFFSVAAVTDQAGVFGAASQRRIG